MTRYPLHTFHAPLTLSKFYVEFYLSKHLSVLDLNNVIILPNAGVISTSAEFLFHAVAHLINADIYNFV